MCCENTDNLEQMRTDTLINYNMRERLVNII